jgi:hypothetical protein
MSRAVPAKASQKEIQEYQEAFSFYSDRDGSLKIAGMQSCCFKNEFFNKLSVLIDD